jgi:hypothetical protein
MNEYTKEAEIDSYKDMKKDTQKFIAYRYSTNVCER